VAEVRRPPGREHRWAADRGVTRAPAALSRTSSKLIPRVVSVKPRAAAREKSPKRVMRAHHALLDG